jgi:hypothetical protein
MLERLDTRALAERELQLLDLPGQPATGRQQLAGLRPGAEHDSDRAERQPPYAQVAYPAQQRRGVQRAVSVEQGLDHAGVPVHLLASRPPRPGVLADGQQPTNRMRYNGGAWTVYRRRARPARLPPRESAAAGAFPSVLASARSKS